MTRTGPDAALFADLERYPLCTPAEERALACRVRAGDRAARDELVSRNLRLVMRIARGYARRGADLMDAFGDGTLGLITAVEKFEPGRGLKLSTYGSLWVRQAIARGMDDLAEPVRVPAYARHARPHGAAACIEQARRIMAAQVTTAYPDEIPAREAEEGFDGDDLAKLAAMLPRLIPAERDVIRCRFGIGGPRESLKEVGIRMGVSRERVRQIQEAALGHLREMMDPDPDPGRKGVTP